MATLKSLKAVLDKIPSIPASIKGRNYWQPKCEKEVRQWACKNIGPTSPRYSLTVQLFGLRNGWEALRSLELTIVA
jgi:hypothetical protein